MALNGDPYAVLDAHVISVKALYCEDGCGAVETSVYGDDWDAARELSATGWVVRPHSMGGLTALCKDCARRYDERTDDESGRDREEWAVSELSAEWPTEQQEAAGKALMQEPCQACGHAVISHDDQSSCWSGDCECNWTRWEAVARILADRTATLARELAEVRERLARVEAILSGETERCPVESCGWHDGGQAAGAGPCVGRGRKGCLLTCVIEQYDPDEPEEWLKRRLRAALHAPADAPQGGSEGLGDSERTDAP